MNLRDLANRARGALVDARLALIGVTAVYGTAAVVVRQLGVSEQIVEGVPLVVAGALGVVNAVLALLSGSSSAPAATAPPAPPEKPSA